MRPSIASLGVLNPKPMLFQNRFPPFPGLFPFPDFFELQTTIRIRWSSILDSKKKIAFPASNKTFKHALPWKTIRFPVDYLPKKHLGLLQKSLLRLQYKQTEFHKCKGQSDIDWIGISDGRRTKSIPVPPLLGFRRSDRSLSRRVRCNVKTLEAAESEEKALRRL